MIKRTMAQKRKLKRLEYEIAFDTQKTQIGKVYRMSQTADGKWHEVELGENQVLLGGLQYLCKLVYRKGFQAAYNWFEHDLYKDAETDLEEEIIAKEDPLPYVQAFNVSYDGVQGDGKKVYPRHKCGYDFDTLIPFRMIPEDLNDYAAYKHTYLHHRVVEVDGTRYVQYFSKRCSISYRAKLDDDTDIPQYPNENLTTSKDSRVVAEFTVDITDEELMEFFRIMKEGGAEGTYYNCTMLMIGREATHTINGVAYPSLKESLVWSRCPHVAVPHGIDGEILCKYRIMHI